MHCIILVFVLIILSASKANGALSEKTFTHEVTIPYFTNTSMTCDHPSLNISLDADNIEALTWVFPNGENVASPLDLDPRKYLLLPPSSSVTVVGDRANLDMYNLTLLKIDDDVFGYYMCVVEYTATTNKRAAIVRWAINVDGADFSELIESYKKNAIIGGVAAAAMLVLVGAGCIFWQYRYGSDEESESDDDPKKNGIQTTLNDGTSKTGVQGVEYTNASFSPEVATTSVEVRFEKEDNMINVPL